jgi:hypothetical protein
MWFSNGAGWAFHPRLYNHMVDIVGALNDVVESSRPDKQIKIRFGNALLVGEKVPDEDCRDPKADKRLTFILRCAVVEDELETSELDALRKELTGVALPDKPGPNASLKVSLPDDRLQLPVSYQTSQPRPEATTAEARSTIAMPAEHPGDAPSGLDIALRERDQAMKELGQAKRELQQAINDRNQFASELYALRQAALNQDDDSHAPALPGIMPPALPRPTRKSNASSRLRREDSNRNVFILMLLGAIIATSIIALIPILLGGVSIIGALSGSLVVIIAFLAVVAFWFSWM